MPQLTPTEAAKVASSVYLLLNGSVTESRERGIRFGTEGKFALHDNSQFRGETGALAWKRLSNFGYIAWGEGAYTNEVLVVTRGTKINNDWLTNLSIGLRPGPAGWPVHMGFLGTWNSFSADLAKFLAGRNPNHIHCVGHSLGGALAALTADWVTTNRMAEASLYTFGAPRCGDAVFAGTLTQRVGAANVHRVYHPADVVPMIPMLPFFHAPLVGAGLRLPTGSGALFSTAAHAMEDSYFRGVGSLSWADLANAQRPGDIGTGVEAWLEAGAQGSSGMLMGSTQLLSMIGRALTWLVRRSAWVMGSALGSGVTAGLTLMDQLAWLLPQASKVKQEVATHVKALMSAILRFLGRKVVGTADVTQAFVHWLLATLVTTLSAIARRALSRFG